VALAASQATYYEAKVTSFGSIEATESSILRVNQEIEPQSWWPKVVRLIPARIPILRMRFLRLCSAVVIGLVDVSTVPLRAKTAGSRPRASPLSRLDVAVPRRYP
jgi:hypothetical protein